ncbi:helix-turn-helix domain-containing protein [Reichenbachiella sp.]|uniref:AraC family transcriptional regulator n=1 Tax=Reichenbachiella sp. TaxID=2184521 RepID=UPI003B5BFF1F
MTLLRYILLFQGFLALFIAGGLFFKHDSIKNRSIAIFILLIGGEILEFLYSTSELVFIYPQFFGYYLYPAAFAYGPVYFIHVLSLQKDKKISYQHLLHFVPTVAVIISLMDFYWLDGNQRIEYSKIHFNDILMPYNYAKALHILGYGILSGVYLNRIRFQLPSAEKIYVIAIYLIYILSAMVISWLTWFADGWRQFAYYYLITNTVLIVIAYVLHTNPNFLKEFGKKYLGSALSNKDMDRVVNKLTSAMSIQKLYLDSSVSLKRLSQGIEESQHHISQTLSESVGKNFNDYINDFRVEHAKRILSNPELDHFKIEAVALESGFNNKVTFHKAFVKRTGLTPAVLRNNRQID